MLVETAAVTQPQNLMTFWSGEEKGLIINDPLLLDFLTGNGFFKVYNENGKFHLVHIDNNIVREVTLSQIIDFVMNYVKSINEPEVLNLLINERGVIDTKWPNLLETCEIEYLRDTVNTAYFFFKNCISVVTKDSIGEIDYKDAPGYVDGSKIIDHDFIEMGQPNCIAREFMRLLGGSSQEKRLKGDKSIHEDRVLAFESIFGYLLTNFKDRRFMPAISFLDSKLNTNDEANGGVGKSLLTQFLGELRKVCLEDGKNFKVGGNKFAFQNISESTELVIIDDVQKKFDLEQLFSQITGDTIVEKKFKSPVKISFNKSPKLVMTSNYPLEGSGSSFARRLVEFEISDYFGSDHNPYDEFGHYLIGDWDEKEKICFFNYMMYCVQVYLKNDVIKAKPINLLQNRLIATLGQEFLDFADEIEVNVEHDKQEMFHMYNSETQISSHAFTKMLGQYAGIKGYNFDTRKSNSQYFFTFKTLK
jgi:hypothetical protein